MSLLGYDGLRSVAEASHANTQALLSGLTAIDGVEQLYDGAFFHEVAIKLDRPVAAVLESLAKQDMLGGFDLSAYAGTDALLVCATETKTAADIDAFVSAFADTMNSNKLKSA
jgi:glycine dehydrogenase subunit 1